MTNQDEDYPFAETRKKIHIRCELLKNFDLDSFQYTVSKISSKKKQDQVCGVQLRSLEHCNQTIPGRISTHEGFLCTSFTVKTHSFSRYKCHNVYRKYIKVFQHMLLDLTEMFYMRSEFVKISLLQSLSVGVQSFLSNISFTSFLFLMRMCA